MRSSSGGVCTLTLEEGSGPSGALVILVSAARGRE